MNASMGVAMANVLNVFIRYFCVQQLYFNNNKDDIINSIHDFQQQRRNYDKYTLFHHRLIHRNLVLDLIHRDSHSGIIYVHHFIIIQNEDVTYIE